MSRTVDLHDNAIPDFYWEASDSNRKIGRRLYLSHRAIRTHLYRVFPKLGITSRAELGAALAPIPVAVDSADGAR